MTPEELLQLPRYRSHKIVRAAKIQAIDPGTQTLVLELGKLPTVREVVLTRAKLPIDWFVRHKPEAGGYLVVYDDDYYVSYSPAKAFEHGYTRIEETTP